MKKLNLFSLAVAAVFVIAGILVWTLLSQTGMTRAFNGAEAYADVLRQVEFGPRIPGSQSHAQTVDWVVSELQAAHWEVEVLEQPISGRTARNIVARRGESSAFLILGAHYDSRQYADQDPDPARRAEPVPGANDGASGVAVLLELARSLPTNLDKEIWLVFFDLEDQGGIDGQNWIEGSTAFAGSLERKPEAVVIVDMIGDAEQNIYYERNSDRPTAARIWQTAADLGYADTIIPEYKFSMLDDHTPFLQAGIPAVDMIDFDYPSWHTTADTADKVSAESLERVGNTLWNWVQR
jgi:Zn-dependent M28 family amino/carboxypeptidase